MFLHDRLHVQIQGTQRLLNQQTHVMSVILMSKHKIERMTLIQDGKYTGLMGTPSTILCWLPIDF